MVMGVKLPEAPAVAPLTPMAHTTGDCRRDGRGRQSLLILWAMFLSPL